MQIKRVICLLLVMALSLLLVSQATGGAVGPLEENWCVIEQQGQPIGYGSDKVWTEGDGYRYTSDVEIQMSLAGNISITTLHLEMAVTKDYYAKSFVSQINTNGSHLIMSGRFEAKQVTIATTTPDGRDHQAVYPIDQPLYFENSFLEMITTTRKLQVGATYHGPAWDIEKNAVEDYMIKVTAAQNYEYGVQKIPVWLIEEQKVPGSKFLVDAQGIAYWQSSVGGIQLRKVEQNQIPQLKAGTVDMLLIPGNLKIDHPLRSTASQIAITWSGIPDGEFKLEDNRQKLLQSLQNGPVQQAIVRINKEGRDFSGRVTLPVADPALASYLTDSDYITPSLPAIQNAVQEIIGPQRDGWVVTQKLINWVYSYIRPELIQQTLTTEQIWQDKKGKCTEYAILFAALARSAGLPTRLAVGERYIDHSWVSHMWDEVWLGEWVAVDASTRQPAPDALLLKFSDGASVAEATNLRLALTGNLGITIQDVQPAELANPKRAVITGLSGQVYTNADFNCQLRAPATWNLIEKAEPGIPELVMADPSNQAQGIFLMLNVPAGTAPEQLLAARIPILAKLLPRFTEISRITAKIGPGDAVVGTWTFEQHDTLYRQQNWLMVRGDIGYLFVFETSDAKWNHFESSFQFIRDNFALLGHS